MKKTLAAIAAIAAIAASCSKSEVAYEATGEITFTPVAKNITKAMMNNGDVFNTDEEFNVWAFYNPTTDLATSVNEWIDEYRAAIDNGAQPYLRDVTFAYDDTQKYWAGKTCAYFWPKVGSLAFAGYHPSSATAEYVLSADTNTLTFKDVKNDWVSADETNTEDLMYFNLTKAYTQNNVEAVFKHALSWLTINVKTTQETLDAKAAITVSSVKFTDVAPQGTGVVDNQSAIAWTTSGTAEDVETVESTVTLSVDDAKLKEPLFIPQTMAGNLEVTYTITSEDSASFTETKVSKLTALETSAGGTLSMWEPGKHYIYNITISTSEILIDATVAEWVEVPYGIEIK